LINNNHKINPAKKQGFFFLTLLVIVILLIPFANLFHILSPVNVFGKSIWVVLPAGVVGLFYLYLITIKRSISSTSDILFIAIIVLFGLIFFAREIAYNEFRSILDFRYIATSLIGILLAWHLMNYAFIIRVLAYAVVIQGILVAATRSINFYFFPNVMVSYRVGTDLGREIFLNYEGEVTRDLLLGSSISANHIVCGMFVLLILIKHNICKIGPLAFLSLQFLMMLSTFNTLSRFPILVAIGFFVLSLLQMKLVSIQKIFQIGLFGFALFILISWMGIESFNFFERFNEDISGRYYKLQAAFLLISNSGLDFLIGSSSVLANSIRVKGMLISDNSYTLIATTFGIPFAVVFFMFLFNIFHKIKSDKFSIIFLLYIAIGLGVTNCILWESWIFTAFFSFSIVSYYGRLSSGVRVFNTGVINPEAARQRTPIIQKKASR
jgi:hypothetical protein